MGITVEGIVARRDMQPYIVLSVDGHRAQMSMAEARDVARNIERMCARTEADAMIYGFFAEHELPEGAVAAMMVEFRGFRSKLDAEKVETHETDPDEPIRTGEEKGK